MKLGTLILYALLASAITAGILLVIYNVTRPELVPGTQVLPYEFSVADYPGIDVGIDIFRLGAVTPSASSFRTLSITDPYAGVLNDTATAQQAKRVRIVAVGEGSRWITIVPSVTLVPAVVNVSVAVPPDAKHDVYKGALLVIPEPLPAR